ncbi:MAG TPA: hypothetical protein VFT64_07715 [Rickettsiales bacterium]|nr:hypothetical protein [Rickettsiales bacterium]
MFFKKGKDTQIGESPSLDQEKWFKKLSPNSPIRKVLAVFASNSMGLPEIEGDKAALMAARRLGRGKDANVVINRYSGGRKPEDKALGANPAATMSQEVINANTAAMEKQLEHEAAAKAVMEKQFGQEAVAKAEEEERAAAAAAKTEEKDEERSCPFNANERLFIRLEGLDPHNLTSRQMDQYRNWFNTHNLAELEAEERCMNRVLSPTENALEASLHFTDKEQAQIDSIRNEFAKKFGSTCYAQDAELPDNSPTVGTKQRVASTSMGGPD